MKELILHVAIASDKDERFGAVKLNKILFYADFLSYFRRGRSITNQEYFAIREGPAPRQMLPILKQMKAAREIEIIEVEMGLPRPKNRAIALRPPDYDLLEAEDVAIVDEIIKKFWDKTGTDLTKLSHDFAGWKIAMSQGTNVTIQYSMAQFDAETLFGWEPPPLPDNYVEYAKQFAEPESESVA